MYRPRFDRWTSGAAALVAAVVVLTAGCSVNPATGKRQFTLYDERDEIDLGRQAHGETLASFGVYPDSELQEYVSSIGEQLAATSERPDLPWNFVVVDDPVVNAFALPGGFIYITRGILAHFNSEAELAAVMGHEIGHVTARHGVEQMSKAQITGVLVGVGQAVAPELSPLVESGAGLLFLKFGRDDKRQADDLGLRYMMRADYDPRPMVEVFDMLGRVTAQAGGGGPPSWLSTHPAPENRRERSEVAIAQLQQPLEGRVVNRGGFLARIDGIVFGEDPRQGYFKDNVFRHPEMKFVFDFPQGWKVANQRDAVLSLSPEGDAMLRIRLASQSSPQAALSAFTAQEGVYGGDAWVPRIHGLETASSGFRASASSGALEGTVAFVAHDGRVFEILGLTPQSAWQARRATVLNAMASFRELTDPDALGVQPARVRVVTLDRAMTVEEIGREHNSMAKPETLALLNDVGVRDRIEAGSKVKVVVGGRLP